MLRKVINIQKWLRRSKYNVEKEKMLKWENSWVWLWLCRSWFGERRQGQKFGDREGKYGCGAASTISHHQNQETGPNCPDRRRRYIYLARTFGNGPVFFFSIFLTNLSILQITKNSFGNILVIITTTRLWSSGAREV